MAFDPSALVSVIEGIGSTNTEALARIGVVNLLDLLQRREETVHAAVRSDASRAQVHSWRQMTALLQVREITPQWAEALVRGGIETIDELTAASFDRIKELFHQSNEERMIPSIPEDNALAGMLADAAVLRNTGNLTGRVEESAGQPVAGATASMGLARVATDTEGRFRLLRIPLAGRPPLIIKHPQYRTLVINGPSMTYNVDVVNVLRFRLEPLPVGDERPVESVDRLSELEGNVLPPMQGHRVRSVRLEANQLRDHDVLMVRYFFRRSDDLELVSRLKTYEDGEVVVHTFRFPKSRFASDVQVGDHFLVKGDELVKVEMDPIRLLRHKLVLRSRKQLGPIAANAGADELRARLRERLDFTLSQYRRLRPRRRGSQ
jgi:hypothetical protein